jgi:ABC-type phosphate transport system auxiliary subunit
LSQEKQKLHERQIEELTVKVNALELEKRQLQRALERATEASQVIPVCALLLCST